MITELQDTELLARIEGGNLIARDKVSFEMSGQFKKSLQKQHHVIESRASVELANYIKRSVYS